MKKTDLKLSRFWNADRSLTIILLLLMLFIFVCIPGLRGGKSGSIIIKIIYSFLLITGTLSVARNKKFLMVLSIFTIAGLFVNWLSEVKPTILILVTHDAITIVFNLLFALAILVKTFQKGEITYQRIAGSIVVYLLIGLMFAYVFHAVYLLAGPSSYNNIHDAGLKEFLYFSFTSLTTMGYGDITPVHSLARSFANFEALIGQLYPAILIARLVSMEFESSTRKRQKNE